MFFANIVGMREHPGNRAHERTFKSIADCADIADKMLVEYDKRFEERQWPSGQQP